MFFNKIKNANDLLTSIIILKHGFLSLKQENTYIVDSLKCLTFPFSNSTEHTLFIPLPTICMKLSRACLSRTEHGTQNSNGQMYSNVQRG